ncbi:unnamed protein product, partial [Meganyctiphanes norvegica]
ECRSESAHEFPVEIGEKFSFSADIRELGGLVLDIHYVEGENDRIKLSSKKSSKFIFNGAEYIETKIDSLINDGWHDLDVVVDSNTLHVTCKTSKMSPLTISIHSGIKSVRVSSEELKICEESCLIEKSVEKNINNEEKFNIAVFTTSTYPITFNISNSVDSGSICLFEMKPGDCTYTYKHNIKRIPCAHIIQGWNKLNIYVNRNTLTINDNNIPFDVNLKTLHISGSFLVNCTKGTPVWKISNEEIHIPVSFGQQIVFILTSTDMFSPVFNFDGNKMTLNWNNGLKIKLGSSENPLPNSMYYIKIEATSEKLILYDE